MSKDFAGEVREGLMQQPKTLPSKYFYDQRGSELFQQIMSMPEYYLTRAEYDIFSYHQNELLQYFTAGVESFQLIELGAGDGRKTKVLLEYFISAEADFSYLPIDISSSALDELTMSLKQQWPKLKVEGMHGDYFKVLNEMKPQPGIRKVVLFMGANIGNYTLATATSFLVSLRNELDAGDMVVIGFDLKKDPRMILKAYDDPHGFTRAFNLNLLSHINAALNADFNTSAFEHYEVYDPVSGEARSYLYALSDQDVTIRACDQTFHFPQWDIIQTEMSKKYSIDEISRLASAAGYDIAEYFFDKNNYFADVIFQVRPSS